MAYGVSNGHVINDITWPWKVKLVMTPILSEPNISKTAGDAIYQQSLLLDSLLWCNSLSAILATAWLLVKLGPARSRQRQWRGALQCREIESSGLTKLETATVVGEGRRALIARRRLLARSRLLSFILSDWSWLSAAMKWRAMVVLLGLLAVSGPTAARRPSGDRLINAPSCILSRSSLR